MSESHEQLEPCNKISQISNKMSLGSLYASISSLNISLSSRKISRESCSASLLKQKNDQIKELLTYRITALHYFTHELTTDLSEEAELTRKKANVSLLEKPYSEELSKNVQEDSIKSKELLDKIYNLGKDFKKERKRLDENLGKVNEIENEEEDLKERIINYEKEITKILQEKKAVNSGCQCRLF
ncbi:hypothetical protein SteCoe_31471 [Stentor coeruleus]|uniref:Uncharacterized protein n=1 Tax=Stentor coeruleus TaxID=5963 RepID=A0A1R2B1A2_9CILI|nr:hypothetical protein SteCoe_31471 [Stentor coeruleus]